MGFNRSGTTQAVTLDISNAFVKVWHAGLFTNLSPMKFLVKFGLISSFLSNRRL